MKKVLLAAAFCAVVSLNSFGAACVNGTIASLVVTCSVGSTNQWNLSSFGLANAGGFGYTGNVGPGDIFVSFSNVVSGGGAAGFAVTFSDGPTAPNYFTASSAGVSQSQNWRSMFIIENGPAIQLINNSWLNANVTNPQPDKTLPNQSNGSISLNKAIFNASVTPQSFLADITLLAVPGALIPGSGSANVPIGTPNTITRLGVEDNFQIQAGVDGTSSLTSYTNTFYGPNPTGQVPEPMTFVLMGAGLVGIAALRRRNS